MHLNKSPLAATLICILSGGVLNAQMEEPMTSAIAFADSQMRATLAGLSFDYSAPGVNPDWVTNIPSFPKVTNAASGDVIWDYQSRTGNWGAGFTPGLMWDLYSLTGDSYWLEKADAFTDGIEPNKTAGGDMQMNIGFHFMNSYARRIAYEGPVAGDLDVMSIAANRLANDSWMPTVGSLWSFSWNNSLKFDGLVGGWFDYENTIIDSSPNIEILFYQAKQETNTVMWDRAMSHFSNLIRDNIREDGSTAQLVSYDITTGELLGPRGHQGYSYASTWSRGQGWALHGFASAWRETRDPAFGEVFHDLYSYYRDNCPSDGVPYWDFDAPGLTDEQLEFRYPGKNAPALRYGKDSSAAALAASALMLASELAESNELRDEYFAYGLHILETLSTPGYLAADDSYNPLKESILGQGSYTFTGIEKGQIWGDFFYVEALRRYRDLVEPATVFDDEPGWGNYLGYSVISPQRWKVVPDLGDSALRLQGRGAQSDDLPADLALYRHATLDDFDISFEFRADELLVPGNPVDVVFVCGYIDEENYLFVRPSTSASRSGVFKVENGVMSSLSTLDPIAETQGYHTLTVSVTGNQMDIAIDGSVESPVVDPAIGAAGFVGFGGTGNSLLFDTINVFGAETFAELSPRESWRELNFTYPRSILAQDGFDPDLDGRANLLEYAFGTDPLVASGQLPGPSISVSGPSAIDVSFPYNSAFSDITYKVMESLDGGATWNGVHSITPSGTDAWHDEVYSVPSLPPQAVFYRIQVDPRY
jgi:unsaturated chondroitin disaccharide hydrolase